MNSFLYRGMNLKSVADLYPSEYLFPSDKLSIGKHEKNAVDKHQNPNRYNEADFKDHSAYLSTTPLLNRAMHYATSGNKISGVVFVIDRNLLVQHHVTEYCVSEIATVITVPEDEELLLLTKPLGSPLPDAIIMEIRYVHPNLC